MAADTRGQLPDRFDPRELLHSADFFKREGENVSEGLQAFERQIVTGLSDDSREFRGAVPSALLSELGAEIFDTLLNGYLKWYRCSLIAAIQGVEQDCLSFAGYAQLERPHHLGLGVTYEMMNAATLPEVSANGLRRIDPVPGSVRVVVEASKAVRAVVAAMKIEKTVSHMLADPSDIVRKTLECRMAAAYGYRERIGDVGLWIDQGVVGVTIRAHGYSS